MDNKTMIKVINGMADKIESLEDKIKHNAENIDTIHDNTNDNLEEISENKFKIDDLETFKKTAEEVMSKLNNKIKYIGLMEVETMETESLFMDRIDNLENKIKSVEREIPDINQDTDITDRLNDKYDDLEAKNYQLRSELDGVYKVLEMDACDIQDLQEEISLKFGKYNNKMESK